MMDRSLFVRPTRKGQSSLEFVLIAAGMFFVFIGIFGLITSKMADVMKSRADDKMQQLGNVVNLELRLADSSRGNYFREFSLPETVGDYNYTIITSDNEVTLFTPVSSYFIFLNSNVTGSLRKGRNNVSKYNDTVWINR